VRELENAIERAVTMNTTGEILPDDLLQFGLIPRNEIAPPQNLPRRPKNDESNPSSLDDVVREHMIRVLRFTNGNKMRAAKILGVGRYTLYRMAGRLGIDLSKL
jgi:DNA-binding NtrC family response regulator